MNPASRKARLSFSAIVMLAVILALCIAWMLGSFNTGWLGEALRSRISLLVGGISLFSLVLLYLLIGVIWKMGKPYRTERNNPNNKQDKGTAAIEFALVFPIALVVVLIMVQSSLLLAGNMAVHYAAYAAARAAIVWIPENVSYEEPKNVMSDSDGSVKMYHIRAAAIYAVMPVSASKPVGNGSSEGDFAAIQQGIERFYQLYGMGVPGWVQTMLPGKFAYAWNHTSVWVDPPANGETYGDHETIKVHVRHDLYLPVPYVNRIFGDVLCSKCGDYATRVDASCALTNQGVQDEIDVETFPRYVGQGGA